MLKHSVLISALLSLIIGVSCQSQNMLSHAEASVTFLNEAEKKLNDQKIQPALYLVKEAIDEAELCNEVNLELSAKLLEFRINNSQNNFFRCVEILREAEILSQKSDDDLKLAVWINSLMYYEKLDIHYKVIEICETALNEVKTEDTKINFLQKLTGAYEKISKYDKALEASIAITEITRKKNTSLTHIKALERTGNIAFKLTRYDIAEKYYNEQITVASWAKKNEFQAAGLNNLANCYIEKKQYNQAFELLGRALKLVNKTEKIRIEILNNLSYLKMVGGDLTTALKYCDESIELSKNVKDTKLLIHSQLIKAAILESNGEHSNALEQIKNSFSLSANENLSKEKEESLKLFIHHYQILNDRENEKIYLEQLSQMQANNIEVKNIENSKQNELVTAIDRTEKNATYQFNKRKENILEEQKSRLDMLNKEQQFTLFSAKQELIESENKVSKIAKEKAQQELALAKIALQNQMQEVNIINLEKQKTEQSLAIAKLDMEKQIEWSKLQDAKHKNILLLSAAELQNKQTEQERNVKRFFISVLAVAVLALFFMLSIIKRIREKNKRIKSQNQELDEKNKDIISSLESAQHFQAAIIPSEGQFKKSFQEAFLLYKPLDIVSGDLPFIIEHNNQTWVAAIDCMGHGVPAAMLTFNAYYNLKEIILKSNDLKPGEILSILHKSIIQSLTENKLKENFNSGLDIGLVKIAHNSRVVQFAGANSPLIICKDDKTEVIKGNKFSIADVSTDGSLEPTSIELKLSKGDKFFLLSDGILHQIKDEEGVKLFGMKKLLSLIESHKNKTMNEIKEIITHEHLSWRGNNHQTDDMLAIGIEI